MKQRFIHHFTFADIGSLVTFRPHYTESILNGFCLAGKVGIVRGIEVLGTDQLLTVDFNYILKNKDSDKGIGPVWKISGNNLAPLAQWMIDGDGKTSLLSPSIRRRVSPAPSIDANAIQQASLDVVGTPSAYFFSSPPSVEIVKDYIPSIALAVMVKRK